MKMKKRIQRRQGRIRGWEELMASSSSEAKVQRRKDSNGYRCPGSLKR